MAVKNKRKEKKKNVRITINLYEKMLLFITWHIKNSSKQVVPMAFAIKKKVFAVGTFEGLWVVLFGE